MAGRIEQLTQSPHRIDENHVFPSDFGRKMTVLVDGVPTLHVREAYVGEHGWVIAFVPDTRGHPILADDRLSIVTERREGRVEVVDAANH